jgi:hypothetical protein
MNPQQCITSQTFVPRSTACKAQAQMLMQEQFIIAKHLSEDGSHWECAHGSV